MRQGKPNASLWPGLSGTTLVFLFIAVATLPMLAALTSGIEAASPFSELGTAFALTATALLFLQLLSSGRYERLSGRVGIDRTMGFHRIAAYVLLALALLHPLSYAADTLIADPIAAWHRLIGMLASPRLRSGTLSMAGLIVIVGLATVRSRPFIRYEYWRASHGLLAIAVAALTLHLALASGTYSARKPYALVPAWPDCESYSCALIFLSNASSTSSTAEPGYRIGPLRGGTLPKCSRGPDPKA